MQGGHADVDAAPRGCYFLVLQGWMSNWTILFVGQP